MSDPLDRPLTLRTSSSFFGKKEEQQSATPPPQLLPTPTHPGQPKGSSDECTAMKAIVRVRPFMPMELKEQEKKGLLVPAFTTDGKTIFVQRVGEHHNAAGKETVQDQAFTFDSVIWSVPKNQLNELDLNMTFPEAQGQAALFSEVGEATVQSALEGYNTCVFAYGQTGSGKSHSLVGPPFDPGLAPRIATRLFSAIAAIRQTDPYSIFSVDVACLEIYNEKILDLLSSANLTARELAGASGNSVGHFSRKTLSVENSDSSSRRSPGPTFVAGSASQDDLSTLDDDAMPPPRRRHSISRSVAASSPPSSENGDARSEGDLLISPTTHRFDSPQKKPTAEVRVRYHPEFGTFVTGLRREIVDDDAALRLVIARSLAHRAVAATKMNDQSSRSHAIVQINVQQESRLRGYKKLAIINIVDLAGSERVKRSGVTGSNFTETKNINLSLTTLRRVIDALIDQSKGGNAVPPFRESMLTWLLADSVGGNSRTSMIATVSPYLPYLEESLNTLRYANKAKSIVCHVKVNSQNISVTVEAVKTEVDSLKKKLAGMCDQHNPIAELALKMQTTVEKKSNVLHLVEVRTHRKAAAENALRLNVEQLTEAVTTTKQVLERRQEASKEIEAITESLQLLSDERGRCEEAMRQIAAHSSESDRVLQQSVEEIQRFEEKENSPNFENRYRKLLRKIAQTRVIAYAYEVLEQRERLRLHRLKDGLVISVAARAARAARTKKAIEEHSAAEEKQAVSRRCEIVDAVAFRQIASYERQRDIVELAKAVRAVKEETVAVRRETQNIETEISVGLPSLRAESRRFDEGLVRAMTDSIEELKEESLDLEESIAAAVLELARAEAARNSEGARLGQLIGEEARAEMQHREADSVMLQVEGEVIELEKNVGAAEAEVLEMDAQCSKGDSELRECELERWNRQRWLQSLQQSFRGVAFPDVSDALSSETLAQYFMALSSGPQGQGSPRKRSPRSRSVMDETESTLRTPLPHPNHRVASATEMPRRDDSSSKKRSLAATK